MLGQAKLPLVIVDHPSGRYGYVGSIPTKLCEKIPATSAALIGGRAWKEDDGKYYEWKVPTFETKQEAIDFAESNGITNYDFPRKA
ncbi:MAG: hypothetical protein R3230_00550 [Nitrosopumilaceae archaeon]|nr:hypothetical protein [Nitrosopumilaceae archaeon]